MSITRLQQARQMYATGQRVAKTLDGSRPGYRGSDMATVGTSSRAANTSAKNTSGADYGGGIKVAVVVDQMVRVMITQV